jgi:hypothetical protein
VWYPSFGEIPGLSYVTPDFVDPARLRRSSVRPEIHRYKGADGNEFVAATWPGGTSQSPASGHIVFDLVAKLDTLRRRAAEALELPGTASDYHFALMGAADVIHSRRREATWALEEVERLCWLDVRLIELRPDDNESDLNLRQVGQRCFNHLLSLYQREGYWLEALQVTDRAAAVLAPMSRSPDFDPRVHFRELGAELKTRIATLESGAAC